MPRLPGERLRHLRAARVAHADEVDIHDRTARYARPQRAPAAAHEVDPERVERSRHERGAERSRRVHRRARDRTTDEGAKRHRPSDRDRRSLAHARVSVATAMITNIRKNVSTTSHRNDCASEPDGVVAPTLATSPSEPRKTAAAAMAPDALRHPVKADPPQREVARQPKRESHRRVEMCAGHVPDRVDHRHDREAESERDACVPESTRLRVDHDRAAAEEDETEDADRLGEQRTRERAHL